MLDKIVKIIITFAILVAAVSLVVGSYSATKIETVKNCKIIDLQQQQIISGSSHSMETKIRYLVITDKETFICEGSLINLKFNNSDIFFHLKKDSTYNFKVCGIGKSIVTDYRNILQVEK